MNFTTSNSGSEESVGYGLTVKQNRILKDVINYWNSS